LLCCFLLLYVLASGRYAKPVVAGPSLAKSPTVLSEFIFSQAPFKECHASTIVERLDGDLLAAWFGGEHEGDRRVAIWGARRHAHSWSAPFELAREPDTPCWNPVLFADSRGKFWLFYKFGESPRTWSGAYRTSADGTAWSEPTYLPAGILGPIKNKPITLANGDILAGTSAETAVAWVCGVDLSSDGGRTWRQYGPITVPGYHHGIIQPALWETSPGHVKMLVRATQDIGFICAATSDDGGHTWSDARPTSLPNPNSGIDAVKMRNGGLALVYNPSKTERTPLALAFSQDDGQTWSAPLTLEDAPGEYSYPAIIQTRDGKLHITYTWRRQRIKHVVVDPSTLTH
jgi:predicted neuraminidase